MRISILCIGLLLLFSIGCSQTEDPANKVIGQCYPYSQGTVQCIIMDQACYIYNSGNSVLCRKFQQAQ